MRIDEFRSVVRERDGYPGDIGDSCADTARLFVLDPMALFYEPALNLDVFWTPRGYVRHPLAPERDDNGESWREDDFSSDQALPLLLAYEVSRNILRTNLANRLCIASWRTGDGNLVSPGLYALSKFVLSRDRVWLHVLGLINLSPKGRSTAVRDKAAQERLTCRVATHQLGAAGGVRLGVKVDGNRHRWKDRK